MTMITPSLHAGLCSRRARDPIQCLNFTVFPFVYTLPSVPSRTVRSFVISVSYF